ncbi:DUF6087 family protein [Streptomyces antimicrobicus]|uniref:DUF6087 family protein n=1 Tax=Streptomyces antimicrobicus TaxID=2883108 RepID=A0ABS8B4I7_9ACTN|nr:DUF6087 family protein [Streptomyces antimicrobicus]MCB5179524.1 DUF6087 family protein [Streptomyces antimicrobicus]
MDDGDEPLELWAACRDALRRPTGEMKAVLLDGTESPTHVRPSEPRLILRWDGIEWLPQSIAPDYAAAQRVVHGIRGDGVMG